MKSVCFNYPEQCAFPASVNLADKYYDFTVDYDSPSLTANITYDILKQYNYLVFRFRNIQVDQTAPVIFTLNLPKNLTPAECEFWKEYKRVKKIGTLETSQISIGMKINCH